MFHSPDQFFHMGILVADIDAAMAEMAATHNIAWASRSDGTKSVWRPETGQLDVDVKLTYSCNGPVHVELLQGAPGSIWDAATHGAGVHHFGYWVDDVTAETERLVGAGWHVVMAALPPEKGYGRFSYVRSPQGILVEPVSSSARPRFEAWWAGGDLASS